MNDTLSDSDKTLRSVEEDPAFQQAVANCIQQLEDGRQIDAAWLEQRYPQWHENLAVFIADWDAVDGYSNEVRNVQGGSFFVNDTIPDSIGEYEVLEQIGAGGMGVIYKARHHRLSRTVAIKMLHNVRHDRKRFEMEAEAVARLDHPNIVSIYEVNEHQGHPFFTMPFIDGCDLESLIGKKKLRPRHAATIAATIADGVHYAHQRGILHRDLKPGNILIDAEGEPHITDFGLAKQIDSTDQLTRTHAIIGTPSYMAPEQALGKNADVSVVTDVYGVGAILYAMLAGQAPFRGNNSMDVLRQVVHANPQKLDSSTVTQDLRTICEKCLEKNPGVRYQSAGELADDLKRYLAGEPIMARPLGKLQTAVRWARKHPRTASGLTSALLVALAASIIIGATLRNKHTAVAQINSELLTTNHKLENAIRESNLSRDQAMQALHWMTDRGLVLAASNPTGISDGERRFLQRILDHYLQYADQQSSEFASSAIRVESLFRVGQVHNFLGNIQEACETLKQADQLCDELHQGESLSVDQVVFQSECKTSLGEALFNAGETRAAIEQLQMAISNLESIVKTTPELTKGGYVLAKALSDLSNIQFQSNELGLAIETNRKSTEILRKLVERQPEAPSFANRLVGNFANRGTFLAHQGQQAKAREAFLEALSIQETNVALFPEQLSLRDYLARILSNLGAIALRERKLDDAEDYLNRAVLENETLQTAYPNLIEYVHHAAQFRFNLAQTVAAAGRSEDALAALTEGREFVAEALQRTPDSTVFQKTCFDICLNLGYLNNKAKEYELANQYYEEAVAVAQQWVAKSNVNDADRLRFAQANHFHALSLKASGDSAAAKLALLSAVDALETSPTNDERGPIAKRVMSESFRLLGMMAIDSGNAADAVQYWDQVVFYTNRSPELERSILATQIAALDSATAWRLCQELESRPELPARVLFNLACAYGQLSKSASQEKKTIAVSRVFGKLDEAKRLKYFANQEKIRLLNTSPSFDHLRNSPGFVSFVQGLETAMDK